MKLWYAGVEQFEELQGIDCGWLSMDGAILYKGDDYDAVREILAFWLHGAHQGARGGGQRVEGKGTQAGASLGGAAQS